MDVFINQRISINRFIKSPQGRGYFAPSSPVRKKVLVQHRNISLTTKKLRPDICIFSKEFFNYLEKDSPSNCKIIRLKPLSKDRSDQLIPKSKTHETDQLIPKSQTHSIIAKEKIVFNDEKIVERLNQSVNSNLRSSIYLPTVRYISDRL